MAPENADPGRPSGHAGEVASGPSHSADQTWPSDQVWPVVDRLVVAAVDMLDGFVLGGRYHGRNGPELGVAEAEAMARVLDVLVRPGVRRYGAAGPALLLDRLTQWVRASMRLMHEPRWAYGMASDAGRIRIDSLATAVVRAVDAVRAEEAAGAGIGSPPGDDRGGLPHAWRALLDDGSTTFEDLVWTTASLVVDLLEQRRSGYPDHDTNMVAVLEDIGRSLGPDGVLAWRQDGGPVVGRPPTYQLRAALEPGSGALLWPGNDLAERRWDALGPVEHEDLVIPAVLSQRITDLLDEAHRLHLDASDRPQSGPADRWDVLRRATGAVLEELRVALGPAYLISDGIEPTAGGDLVERSDGSSRWWSVASDLRLPSGRTVRVEPAGHHRSRLHLGDGLLLEVCDDDDGTVVDAALFWPPPHHTWTRPHPDEPLDDDHATVRWAADGPIVSLVPHDPMVDPWIPRTDDDQMQLRAYVRAEGLMHFVDVLAGFDRHRDGRGRDGVLLWRGRTTASGHAVLERFLFDAPLAPGGVLDSRDNDRVLTALATVDLRLRPPPAGCEAVVPAGLEVLDGSWHCTAW